MHEIAFSIGSLKIHWYGILSACGFLSAMLALMWKRHIAGVSKDNIMDIGMIAMFAGIAGARIFYVFQFHQQFEGNWLKVFRIDQGGLVFYGGFILSTIVLITYCIIKKINLARLLDVFAPAVALGHAFGRLGCFMQGCCFGKPAGDSWCGVTFPAGSAPAERFPMPATGEIIMQKMPSLPLYPTQLIEAGVNFALFGLLFFIAGKFKKPGRVAGLYVVCYAVLRFLMEFMRGDHTHSVVGLTPSQSVAVFITAPIGILMIVFAGKWGGNGAPDPVTLLKDEKKK
ncbi:MAG: prolipoprotein diacylglyceryl transferase [Lentisphaeria bacterium]|nr:prolipoprotein diacylglyceryl transferase [Lentisphaeria bacterium]